MYKEPLKSESLHTRPLFSNCWLAWPQSRLANGTRPLATKRSIQALTTVRTPNRNKITPRKTLLYIEPTTQCINSWRKSDVYYVLRSALINSWRKSDLYYDDAANCPNLPDSPMTRSYRRLWRPVQSRTWNWREVAATPPSPGRKRNYFSSQFKTSSKVAPVLSYTNNLLLLLWLLFLLTAVSCSAFVPQWPYLENKHLFIYEVNCLLCARQAGCKQTLTHAQSYSKIAVTA